MQKTERSTANVRPRKKLLDTRALAAGAAVLAGSAIGAGLGAPGAQAATFAYMGCRDNTAESCWYGMTHKLSYTYIAPATGGHQLYISYTNSAGHKYVSHTNSSAPSLWYWISPLKYKSVTGHTKLYEDIRWNSGLVQWP